ncbi:MAG: hypothetical protein Q9207_007292 [Kuettlingeria erythrocarpa]
MAFAQPAVKDNFLFNGDLYVDVGNLNRHKRASVAEITEVLRPDLKKPKNGGPIKDPVGHWYEAQLIHYGLPPSKDKARAKMRLLENLNQLSLKVPARIAAIESELKKEFSAAERKAKAQHKATLAATQSTPAKSTPAKKRKTSDSQTSFPSINVNINFSAVNSPVQDNPVGPKKRKLQTARRGDSKSAPPPELGHAALGYDASPAEAPRPRPKQTARRGAASSLSFRPQNTASHPEPPGSVPTYEAFGGTIQYSPTQKNAKPKKEPKPAVKKAAKVKQEPRVKKEPKVKAEPNTKQMAIASPSRIPAAPSLGLINGIYDISCPSIENEWDYDGFTLVLTLDSPAIWGEYDFGMFSGILYIPQRPFTASSDEFAFEWRGRENGEGEMRFGSGCNGGIVFHGNGYVEGWINVYGEGRFEGTRREGPGTAVRTAMSMQDEWDSYNEDEYERERIGRW